jgi:hypothetical protein
MKNNTNVVGFITAILTTVITVVTFGIAILTPPLSGPFCLEGCFGYPYVDIASRFPRDYLWMYPAILLILIYVVLIGSLILITAIYGVLREYRFEVAVISIDWLTLIISGILLSVVFRREMNNY